MPLFEGEELVPVTTPDGRTLQLPRSLAGLSQQLGGAGAPPPMQTPAPIEIPSVTGGQIPAEEAQVVEAAPVAAPDYVAGTVDMDFLKKQAAAQEKQQAKIAKQQAAVAASPQGKQDAAQQKVNDAQQGQVEAINAATDVEAATNDLVATEQQARNVKIAAAEDARADEMRQNLEAEDAVRGRVKSVHDKIANTKIDRTADHPILAAIMVGLAGLGSAMKGEKVDTLNILYTAIDRKVAAQQADLDNLGKVYGMTKDELEMLKDRSKNRLEFHNAMVAGEINKSIRAIEELTSRAASEKTRANGKAMIAELQARAADKTMEATRWGLEYDQRDKHQKQQIGLGYANLRQNESQFQRTMADRAEERAKDMAIALANTKATKSTEEYKLQLEAAKEARQFGVRDMNGDLFLSPEGRAQMAQAKALEDEAAKLEANPDVMQRSIASDKIKAMREKAAVMRGEAQTFGTVKAHNETEAIDASKIIASGQSTVQLIDEIKQIADKAGRGVISRDEAQVQLRAKFNLMKPNLKEAWQLGAWDKGAGGLVSEVIGADPSSAWTAGGLGMLYMQKMYENPQAFQQGLDAVAADLEVKAKNRLVGMGVKFGKDETVLQRSKAPEVSESAAKLSAARSGTERVEDAAQTGVVGKTARAVAYPFSPSHAEEAESAQSLARPGLSREQEAPFEERLRAYNKGGPDGKRAGEELVALVAESAVSRPKQAIAILHNLPPNLRVAARAAVPKDSEVDKQMSYEESVKIGPALTPGGTPVLAQQVLNSIDTQGQVKDIDGFRDLARRAGEGDQIAKKALLEITKQSGHNRSLPRGSIFNKAAR